MMVSRKVQNSRLKIDKLLKSILFYLTLSLKLGFSRSHQSLVEKNESWRSLKDELNWIELSAPEDYPGERLIVRWHPQLAKHRRDVRNDWLKATDKILDQIKRRVDAGQLKGVGPINMTIGGQIDKYIMKKYYILDINDTTVTYTMDVLNIKAEECLDGLYVIRTSLSDELFSSEQCVGQYKQLTKVERAFHSIKTTDLNVRAGGHYSETRVKAHFFICMLSYYVIWRMKEAWRELIFPEEDVASKVKKNFVDPAQRSEGAPQKAETKINSNGDSATSFQTLLQQLSTVVQVETRLLLKDQNPLVFNLTSNLNSRQAKALELISKIKV
jgi:hypothetical protein